jgi:hypothetical protein
MSVIGEEPICYGGVAFFLASARLILMVNYRPFVGAGGGFSAAALG